MHRASLCAACHGTLTDEAENSVVCDGNILVALRRKWHEEVSCASAFLRLYNSYLEDCHIFWLTSYRLGDDCHHILEF